VIASHIREKDKRGASFGMHVIGLQEQVVGDVRRALLVLLGSVGLVLLIACANVANLLLTRAAGREKEVAIRTALGAGWQQLARQLLTESVLLGLLGGAAGLLIAQLSIYMVRAMNPGNIPRLDDIAINSAVLMFSFGVSLATGILFGVAPSQLCALAKRAAGVHHRISRPAPIKSINERVSSETTNNPRKLWATHVQTTVALSAAPTRFERIVQIHFDGAPQPTSIVST
jgi:FtsX-like permease family